MKRNLFRILVVISASIISPVIFALTDKPVDLFYIERNKNKNIVQYAVKVDKVDCKPSGSEPGIAFWRNYEISPTNVESIGVFEKMAYGIKSQRVEKLTSGYNIIMYLEALPEKRIDVRIEKDGKDNCEIIPFVTINKKSVRFNQVYVFAKERFALPPKVEYIIITGQNFQGKKEVEKIVLD